MGTFTYTAKKDRGALFSGEVIGDSKAAVVAELRRKGLTVVSLEEKRGLPDLKTLLENSKRISVRDKAVFARQFATMISSGLAVLRALYVLEEQTENPRFKKIIKAVRDDVEAGSTLSDSMAKHPAAFDRLYVAMVRAGRGERRARPDAHAPGHPARKAGQPAPVHQVGHDLPDPDRRVSPSWS